jgi:hypothetical protein
MWRVNWGIMQDVSVLRNGLQKRSKGRTENCSIDAVKIWKRVIERENFGWADKCKVTSGHKI